MLRTGSSDAMILLDALTEIGHTKFASTEELHKFVWEEVKRFAESGDDKVAKAAELSFTKWY